MSIPYQIIDTAVVEIVLLVTVGILVLLIVYGCALLAADAGGRAIFATPG
jgi:hypothetical protein